MCENKYVKHVWGSKAIYKSITKTYGIVNKVCLVAMSIAKNVGTIYECKYN